MKSKLQDLIDKKQFQSLLERLRELYCFPSAIIDNESTRMATCLPIRKSEA
jgi:hypothetical protein